ncbi:MAG: 2OG-Fe(II) oxygenase [Chryseobacterium sp.]|nr:MAG: 2OG-Fe(II) oxygenase [Chryseobacterium sp.]
MSLRNLINNMPEQEVLDLSSTVGNDVPFPHFISLNIFNNGFNSLVYDWFQLTDEWTLVETDFYEQYEFSLLSITLPKQVACLTEPLFLDTITKKFNEVFQVPNFNLVDVVAHKLVSSQHIGVHNDYINDEETHRLVLQFNQGWAQENGGFLMLFNSSDANDISKVVSPVNNSAFGFEISKISHHAVSKIYDFIRYTIVYTFKKI